MGDERVEAERAAAERAAAERAAAERAAAEEEMRAAMPDAARFLEAAVETYSIAPGPPEAQALALAQKGLWPETWDGGSTWHEQGDPKKAVPARLVEVVRAAKAAVEAQNLAMFGTIEPNSDAAAEYSHGLAVTIEFLVAFTNEHDCWEWPTWRVVRDIVKPLTAATHCRFAELPKVRATGAVGKAESFGSHCWGAQWGLLVAALADKADPKRRVWVDIFAVRQWPGNISDLAFGKIVAKCSSFIIACQGYDTTGRNGYPCLGDLTPEQMFARQTHLLPEPVRKSIAFLRIWCLAEVVAALEVEVVIVMKTGRLEGRRFEPDADMTWAMRKVVDVGQAEAAVPADRERILADARTKPGGLEGINARVTSTIRASRTCMKAPEIQAAACGDVGALRMEGASREQLAEWAFSAAGGGYVALLRELLARGAPVDVITAQGITAVMGAAQNGQLAALRLVLAAPGGEAAVNQQDEDGTTALVLAAA